MNKLILAAGCVAVLMLSGCSSEAPKTVEKKKEAPAEPVTGNSALFKMYQVARSWAPDCEVLKLSNILLQEVKPAPGKWGAWQATFVSPSKQRARSFTFSVIEASETLHKGVFAGNDEAWGGPKGITKPFDIRALKTDTDAAYEAALKKGEEYNKKNPGKTITYLLEKTNRFPDPVWRVVWGETLGTSNFSIYIDANTGKYLETMR
jgi:hypothetical protein